MSSVIGDLSIRLSLNNPTLPENTGDHPVSYTTLWDTILRQANEILRKASAYFAMAELDRPLKR